LFSSGTDELHTTILDVHTGFHHLSSIENLDFSQAIGFTGWEDPPLAADGIEDAS
jgi:hypothetical protein